MGSWQRFKPAHDRQQGLHLDIVIDQDAPARYALRHENKSWLEIPCRRAVAEASRGPDRLSSTMRTFTSSGHRRRRPVSTISRRLMGRVSVRLSMPTVSYISHNSTRRPPPDEYRKPADICHQLRAIPEPSGWDDAWACQHLSAHPVRTGRAKRRRTFPLMDLY
jgi:hypothetical protein